MVSGVGFVEEFVKAELCDQSKSTGHRLSVYLRTAYSGERVGVWWWDHDASVCNVHLKTPR